MNNLLNRLLLSLILIVPISSAGYGIVSGPDLLTPAVAAVTGHPIGYSADSDSRYDHPHTEFAAVVPAGPIPVNRSSEYNEDRSGGAAAEAEVNDVRLTGSKLQSAGSVARGLAVKLLIYPFHSHW